MTEEKKTTVTYTYECSSPTHYIDQLRRSIAVLQVNNPCHNIYLYKMGTAVVASTCPTLSPHPLQEYKPGFNASKLDLSGLGLEDAGGREAALVNGIK